MCSGLITLTKFNPKYLHFYVTVYGFLTFPFQCISSSIKNTVDFIY